MYISSIHQILLFWTCLLSLPNFIPPWHPLCYLKALSPNSESSLKKCQPCPHQPCPQLLLHQKVSSRPWRECPSHPVLSIGVRSRNSTSRISRSQQQHSICWTYPGLIPPDTTESIATRATAENDVAVLTYTAASTIRSFNFAQQEYFKFKETKTALRNLILNQ